MAQLLEADRVAAGRELMRTLSLERESIALTKPQLSAALAAADQWADANTAAFNASLPVAARTNFTAAQKARLLSLVILQRFEKGV